MACALLACLTLGCGGGARGIATTSPAATRADGTSSGNAPAAAAPRPKPHYPGYPVVQGLPSLSSQWKPVVTVRGQAAAWISQRLGVTMLRFEQRLVRLALHAGSIDPGLGSWRYGDAVIDGEVHKLVAAFNGGFRLNTDSGGWMSYGQTAVPLSYGLASIVTYLDGNTDIGSWHQGVPAGTPIASVRQNLHLLVDHGSPANGADACVPCWGATLGGGEAVARSALGVTADHQLIWAAAGSIAPGTLARGMVAAGVARAAELDINPEWVAGYLYRHSPSRAPAAIPVVPGQSGIPGVFLSPYSRDFFTILER
jgi:hypothetical protein